ncbi:MAG TPA: tetratricopeptide repeat protein [Chloroflexota bacterium]
MGKAGRALAEYRRICAELPWDWRSQISLGNALLERGEVDEAIGHLGKAVELKPGEELSHLVLAVGLERKGDLEGAIKEYREVRNRTRTGQNRSAASDKMKELKQRQSREGSRYTSA